MVLSSRAFGGVVGDGRTDGAEDGIRKSGWGQMWTREDQEMASAIRLADTNWSKHVMRDGHAPGSPYSVDGGRLRRRGGSEFSL